MTLINLKNATVLLLMGITTTSFCMEDYPQLPFPYKVIFYNRSKGAGVHCRSGNSDLLKLHAIKNKGGMDFKPLSENDNYITLKKGHMFSVEFPNLQEIPFPLEVTIFDPSCNPIRESITVALQEKDNKSHFKIFSPQDNLKKLCLSLVKDPQGKKIPKKDYILKPFKVYIHNNNPCSLGIWCKDRNNQFLEERAIKNKDNKTFTSSTPENTYIELAQGEMFSIDLPAPENTLFPLAVTIFDLQDKDVLDDSNMTRISICKKRNGKHFNIIMHPTTSE